VDPPAGTSPFLPDPEDDEDTDAADVPTEVALELLGTYIDRTDGPPPAYASFTIARKSAAGPHLFTGAGDLRNVIHDRNGRMVMLDPAFRLEQWLLAEAHVAGRWPEYHRRTVPARIVAAVRWALDEPHGYFRR